MMKVKQRLCVVATLLLALALVFAGFVHIAALADDAGGELFRPLLTNAVKWEEKARLLRIFTE